MLVLKVFKGRAQDIEDRRRRRRRRCFPRDFAARGSDSPRDAL
jgi:hypothetical protein